MNLLHLRYFVALAHIRHYTRAAEQLSITQPTLSHAIRQLETEYGVRLFERDRRQVRLTPLGEQFLPAAERSLSILDAGIEMLQRSAEGSGVIRLGFFRTPGIDFIPELTTEFLKRNRERQIEFTFGIANTRKLLRGLSDRQYDLIFCAGPPREEYFVHLPVCAQDMVLIVPLDHPLAAFDEVDLADTLSYPYVYYPHTMVLRSLADSFFEAIGARPRIVCEIDEAAVMAGMVARGLGIAILPHSEAFRGMAVKILRIRRPACCHTVYMVYDRRYFLPPIVRHFRDFTEEYTRSFRT